MTGNDSPDALYALLNQLGLHPTELPHLTRAGTRTPTFSEYIPHVETVVSAEALRTYRPYWRRLSALWHDLPLDAPTSRDLDALVETTRRHAVTRRNTRNGRAAADHMIDALRCLYRTALHEGHLTPDTNPAADLHRTPRHPEPHPTLTDDQLAAINHTVTTTGDDPTLDTLLIRLHIETACRRTTVLALRTTDLHHHHSLIRLTPTHGTPYWQPISPTLTAALTHHQHRTPDRDPHGPLLRYRHGRPITHRRYDHLWDRLARHHPWITTQHITTRHLRYTTLAWIEDNYGPTLAHYFTTTREPTHRTQATNHLLIPTIDEIATAVSELTNEPHPLALPPSPPGGRMRAEG